MPMKETTIYRQYPDWLYFWVLLIIAALLFMAILQTGTIADAFNVLLLPLSLVVFGRYRRLYTVTDQRVMMRIGLIARNTNEMDIRHIRGMNVRQNPVERLLGIGSIEIISVADGGAEVVFSGIRNPFTVKDRIRSLKPVP